MTERKLITCPESGHLTKVTIEHTPLGMVVASCSRYPGRELRCARECTRRMDRRERLHVDDRERVLVILPNLDDEAADIATMLADELAADGITVEIAVLGKPGVPPLADYDAVVVGTCVSWRRHPRALTGYIREQRDALAALPAFYFTVGDSATLITHRTRWKPLATARFANATPRQRPKIRELAQQVADQLPSVRQPRIG